MSMGLGILTLTLVSRCISNWCEKERIRFRLVVIVMKVASMTYFLIEFYTHVRSLNLEIFLKFCLYWRYKKFIKTVIIQWENDQELGHWRYMQCFWRILRKVFLWNCGLERNIDFFRFSKRRSIDKIVLRGRVHFHFQCTLIEWKPSRMHNNRPRI